MGIPQGKEVLVIGAGLFQLALQLARTAQAGPECRVLFAVGQYRQNPDGQWVALALHTVLAVVVLAFTNATSAHAIARAAHKRGHKPVQAVCDRLQEESQP